VLTFSKNNAIKFKESESALTYKFFHHILPIHIHHLYVQFSMIPSQVAQKNGRDAWTEWTCGGSLIQLLLLELMKLVGMIW
jgi:hypothetical protein